MEDLKAEEAQGYGEVNQSRATLTQDGANRLADEIESAFGKRRVAARKMNPKADVAAKAIADDLRSKPPTLQEVEEARQWIGQNVAGSSEKGERAIGVSMKRSIDIFLDKLQPSDLVGTNDPGGLVNELKRARNATARRKKAELISSEDTGAIDRGINRAATSGAGGNEVNAIRQNIRAILENPKKRRQFEDWEIKAMRDIVKGTPTQNSLRLISRLAPSNGAIPLSGAGAGVAATSLTGNPLFLAPPVAGEAARLTGDALLRRQVRGLADTVRNGAPLVRSEAARPNSLVAAILAARGLQEIP
ncbi:MAG: hypothetical protein AAGD04_01655 [Pseudomonadota bacterium]